MATKQLIKAVALRTFRSLDALGVHVLPKHYYSSVPDRRWLRAHRDLWSHRAPLTGVAWDLQRQLDWLKQICGPYYQEVAGLKLYQDITARDVGPGFGPIESQVLHCFMRSLRPARIVEIGSGVSTLCMVHAAGLNEREGRPSSQITCVEPFPRTSFAHLKNVRHLKQLCQEVPDDVFEQLQHGDLLFVDSSHAVKCGSDVLKIWLDIVPKLPAGVYIHAHDIFLPYLYDPAVLSGFFDWQETSLLLALLTNNLRLTALCVQAALHWDEPEALAQILPDYRPNGPTTASNAGHFPASAWLRTA
jgi:hypothetical protein